MENCAIRAESFHNVLFISNSFRSLNCKKNKSSFLNVKLTSSSSSPPLYNLSYCLLVTLVAECGGDSSDSLLLQPDRPSAFSSIFLTQTTSSALKGAIQLGIGYTVGNLTSKPDRDVLMQDFYVVESVFLPRLVPRIANPLTCSFVKRSSDLKKCEAPA